MFNLLTYISSSHFVQNFRKNVPLLICINFYKIINCCMTISLVSVNGMLVKLLLLH